ncbi:chemokine XC receptor 1-like [Dunckerocampus dactyliophorus]|uniref:chemokine XC receptor 1-like n=1 Tax=Dunckerocampus dactyliophorus TaxID=161453 RepID=UPI0024056F41|nr:chemokine XC receptor 1-like [Dunckerocampus dactyliophorus]XP_054624070.1 chemokine XC receptor 1-like [Dunckerocampus dactyliophorus]
MAATKEFTTVTETTWTDDNYDDEYDDDFYQDEMCNKTGLMRFGKISSPLFLSMVVVLSLLGNILVMVILLKYENVKSLTNAFILNLAVSDLLFTAGLPFWAYYHMFGWTLGESVCKLVRFVFNVGFYSSGLFLIVMTAQRYVAVLNPLSGLVSAAGAYSVLASVLIWILSILVATPAFIFSKVIQQDGLGHCGYEDSYVSLWGIYQQNLLFILISGVFIFCYSQILCRLLRPSSQRRKNKTLKLIFMLLLVFFVGWAPYNITLFLKSLHFWPQTPVDSATLAERCPGLNVLDYAFQVSRLLAFSHCCLNPIFYVFVGSKFKSHLKRVMWSRRYGNVCRSRLTITSLSSGEELVV